MAETKVAPERLIVCTNGHKPAIADWAKDKMKECDVEYIRADLARVDPPAAPEAADKAKARELIGNVNNYAEDDGELSISAFGPLSNRIAAALATVRQEVETSMRSACVEKAKAIAARYEREQFAEAGNQRIVEKARLDTANAIVIELEAVTLDQQQEIGE